MNRLLIMTVGKTHSGKSTFARELENLLPNSLMIDQDNHAEFVNTHYRKLIPPAGENVLKHTVTQAVVDYAADRTDKHVILCNANRSRKARVSILDDFRAKGFTCVLVHFDIPDETLIERVRATTRSKAIFRSAASFEEVLLRQQAQSSNEDLSAPAAEEAEHLFIVKHAAETEKVLRRIVDLVSCGRQRA
ncbi:ATP-binding protein [Saccharibacillus sp. CPCC 101409]|uniref:ATP-binding protein n=1 Tax=Saccharibacillus sp. CPCC 101409 TaxID=3058041 RepID=UPI002671ACE8|nr:ATP-binding protein [Saccharibacillus sp. CPCC 101409]MDO3410528.1 ATP-binding protein [Saccharibacillus sp. CPCC 101409]